MLRSISMLKENMLKEHANKRIYAEEATVVYTVIVF
jgi:hypothetical protein